MRVTSLNAFALAMIASGAISSPMANAQTTSYRYDARGRLIGSTNSSASGTVNTSITYDRADNRANYSVSGAVNGTGGNASTDPNSGASIPPRSGTSRLIVVPLNGFTVIPLP